MPWAVRGSIDGDQVGQLRGNTYYFGGVYNSARPQNKGHRVPNQEKQVAASAHAVTLFPGDSHTTQLKKDRQDAHIISSSATVNPSMAKDKGSVVPSKQAMMMVIGVARTRGTAKLLGE